MDLIGEVLTGTLRVKLDIACGALSASPGPKHGSVVPAGQIEG
ncbi:hypothetical protein ACU063_15485 [Paenibacillus sp. M.A.Huq-81]